MTFDVLDAITSSPQVDACKLYHVASERWYLVCDDSYVSSSLSPLGSLLTIHVKYAHTLLYGNLRTAGLNVSTQMRTIVTNFLASILLQPKSLCKNNVHEM